MFGFSISLTGRIGNKASLNIASCGITHPATDTYKWEKAAVTLAEWDCFVRDTSSMLVYYFSSIIQNMCIWTGHKCIAGGSSDTDATIARKQRYCLENCERSRHSHYAATL
jgi:hypothetical protein